MLRSSVARRSTEDDIESKLPSYEILFAIHALAVRLLSSLHKELALKSWKKLASNHIGPKTEFKLHSQLLGKRTGTAANTNYT